MTLRTLLALGYFASLSLAACSAFSSDDDESAPNPADVARDGAVDSTGADASPEVDGAADASIADAPPGAASGSISFDDFEQGSGCGKWVPYNATVVRDTTSAHTGVASCRLCTTNAGGYADKSVPAKGAGTYTISGYALGMGASSWSSAAYAYAEGGQTGGGGNNGVLGGAWTLTQVVVNASPSAESLLVRYGMYGDAGACLLLDDIDVVYDP